MISEYKLKRRVHFYETDAGGLVHFSCFFRYMEEAEHALWREAGLSISRPGAGIGFPRGAASFEYLRPLRFEDEFEIWIRIAAITRSTIRYTCLLTMDGNRIAAGDLTVVCVNTRPGEPMKSIPIPPEIAACFQVASSTQDTASAEDAAHGA